MFDSVGGGEIILILIAILMLFGPKRIPDLAQSLGKGLREFRKAQQELQNNLTSVTNNSDFRQLTQTFNEIKQDMHSSVQKLGADFGAAATMPALPNLSTLAAPPPATPLAPVPPPVDAVAPTPATTDTATPSLSTPAPPSAPSTTS